MSLTFGTIKPKNSMGSNSGSPFAFLLVFAASLRNSVLDTPGISTGDWKLHKPQYCHSHLRERGLFLRGKEQNKRVPCLSREAWSSAVFSAGSMLTRQDMATAGLNGQ